MNLPLHLTLAPFQGESSFDRIIVFFERLRKTLQFRNSLLFNQLEPGVQLLTLPLSKHGREVLDLLRGVCNFLICLAETLEIVFLPIEALLLFKGDPMSHLQGGGRSLFLPFIWVDHGLRLRLDLLETARLTQQCSPGGDKATHSSVRASISLRFDLAIQELSIPTPFIPSSDEIRFIRLKV